MSFSFIHSADLHLDSPLVGLGRKSREYADRVDDASRQAFDNLIALAIDEDCQFVLVAGDVFDGQWRDYTTGLFFANRMRRLRDAGISVFMILGNHDAENKFAARLDLSTNVHLLSHRKPESVTLEKLGVAIHGRSFPRRDVTENLALEYPAPEPGWFNIGLLHTACTGRELHASYAPCTVEQLSNHGYDYWALGHVHTRELLSTSPYILFPGNLQGRNPRETGSKGATLVRVEDGRVVDATHRELDVVRWGNEILDVSAADDLIGIHDLVRALLERSYTEASGRALALRVRLVGETKLHQELVVFHTALSEDIDTIASGVAGDLWIETVEQRTSPPRGSEALDPTISGTMRLAVEQLGRGSVLAQSLERKLTEIRAKLPAGAHVEDLFKELRASAPARAIDLVLALIDRGHR